SAILTDAFPAGERGLALGLNQVAAIAGSFIGLVLGGILGPLSWRYVFLVSVPFGVLGTVWSYLKLRELCVRRPAALDWVGQPGQPAVQPGPGRADVHPDHLAAGHLPADPRLQLRADPAVGRYRDAAADRRLPHRRPGLGLAIGPVRRPAVRHRRDGGGRAVLRAARAAAGQLRVLAIRADPSD